jgi:hypothetical protein
MKTSTIFLLLSLIALTLSACSPAVPAPSVAAPTSAAAAAIDITFTDAANLRSQLAFGILKLDGTSNAITPAQAKTLLPLWQAMLTLSGDTTTAPEELTAVQDQITQALTQAQIQAIGAMKITNVELNTYYAQFGVSLPTPVPGVTKVPGSKANMSETDKLATRTAAEASGLPTGGGQAAKTLLFEKTIEYLTAVTK